MMASAVFVDPPPPQSLLLYPSLIDQTSLSDLAPLIRNHNYHAYRDSVTRAQLNQIILANALITRLISFLYYAQTLLVRLVVNQNSTGNHRSDFSAINQATQELQKSIVAKCASSFEPDVVRTLSNDRKDLLNGGSPHKSFLDELSPTASTTLLKFLNNIRTDPNYLSTRLLQSKDQDLDALVSCKPSHYVGRKSNASSQPQVTPAPTTSPVDGVMSFHRHDPIYLLTSIIFPQSSDPISLEYQRRLSIWSTCLARLIDEKRGDRVIYAVLDIWFGSNWQCSSLFEISILGFLQNAAKLQSGGRTYEPDCDDDEDAVEGDPEMIELCDKTLVEILTMLNGYGGIPSSVLQLVNAVFVKCSDETDAKSVLFTKWFIEHCLSRSILHPEYRGLLNECYISEDQRLQLQSLYNRLEKHIGMMTSEDSANVKDDELAVHTLVDTLKSKFFVTESHDSNNNDEIPEEIVQKAIVLCPSDVLTTFYALYPKHRPNEALKRPSSAKHVRKPSDDSAKSEITRASGDYIRPILKKNYMFDLHDGSTSSQSEAEQALSEPESPAAAETEEVEMYGLSVKAAINELRRRLGHERCSGERHPSEEVWVALYVSQDGSSLSPLPDFELSASRPKGEDEFIISMDEDDIIHSTVLKLAASSSVRKKPKTMLYESQPPAYRLQNGALQEDLMLLTLPIVPASHSVSPVISTSLMSKPNLLRCLQVASSNSFAQGDYIQSQSFQHIHDLLKSISSEKLTKNDYAPVLGIIARRVQQEATDFLNLARTREVWFSYLLESRYLLEESLSRINENFSQMRCKMWYSSHVRRSKPWQRAKDICEALEKMKSLKPGTIASSNTIPNVKRNSSSLSLNRSNSMTKSESRRFLPSRQSLDGFSFSGRPASLYNISFGMGSDDWFDILAAAPEQGGPHKLSDYQVDITNRWLEEHASENFCRGEEIIHRFIAEVDDVARRLVPDTVEEVAVVATTFWESEEFVEEAKEFGLLEFGGRVDDAYVYGRRSEEIPHNPSGVDLLGLLGRSRGKPAGPDVSDTRSVRSTHSRTMSLTVNTRALPDVFVRPSSSHSASFPPLSPAPSLFSRNSNSIVPMTRSTSNIDEKGANKFLEATRQRLLSLLLSDLGMEMWSAGSETDEWFADGLADSCIERKRLERKKLNPSRKEKKLSIVGSMGSGTARLRMSDDLPTPPLSRESSGTGNKPTAAVDSLSDVAKKSEAVRFDFTAAYKRLLTKFSVHPAPHEKLKALFELERLMNASFMMTEDDDNVYSGSAFQTHSRLPPTPHTSPNTIRKVSTSSAVGTDELVDEIQRVLRNSELRPKTLFRDLAFISAFVPPLTLTHHSEGKVFWDIGLAASAMKADVVNIMVEWYEEIMTGNSLRRGERESRSRAASVGQMQDAARMLIIAACEGNAVGQRELALLHLSHPSLLPLTTLPLTRPSDTFQKISIKGMADDKEKYDPDRISLAAHWFQLAARNGDKYARNVEGKWLGSCI